MPPPPLPPPNRLNEHARANVATAPKKRKPRQEISACLKWISFMFNFLFVWVGVSLLALGIYLHVKDPRPIVEWIDIVLNPAIFIALLGFLVGFISLLGALGALRDNISLLKIFAICVFFCYICIVVLTFGTFVLFFTDTSDGVSAHSIMMQSVKKYHSNRNLADFVDYVQEQMECCGVSSISAGYRDWALSPQFNCTPSNPYPEKCGVPFSCCRKSVISEAAGSTNPLQPAMRSLECWRNALTKRPPDIEADIHTRGCVQPLRTLFETHAVHIGAVVAVILLPVSLSVCLTNILARQIDHQRFLLEREARRNERRVKRDRRDRRKQSRDPFTSLEEGIYPQGEMVPPLPKTSPPTRPPEGHRKHRAQSNSPTRKVSANGVPTKIPPPPGAQVKRVKDKRRKSQPPTMNAPGPQERTRQWILQQTDIVNPNPDPSKLPQPSAPPLVPNSSKPNV
ncbi:unnamed protein product, partial [Mesorhabditis belari]|uniref:Tetraspanin n=1 Tax=Mesorhabditis belari TaxID=2138241 RepID=A0AAF3EQG1_9BILA